MVAPWQKGKDEFNLLRHRNADNTKNDEYNCGGMLLKLLISIFRMKRQKKVQK